MTKLEESIDIGCCRICLLSKVNCKFCKFAFALPIVEAERIEEIPQFVEAIIEELYADDPYMRMRLGLDSEFS